MTGSRRRTRVVLTAGCLVAALGAGAGVWAVLEAPSASEASEAAAQRAVKPTTATVTKGDLTESRTFVGSLDHGRAVGLPGAASGTLTWLPKPGQVIRRDEALYAVDERPVRSMYGSVPLWRSLEYGLKGADVHQLNENLAALGYDVSVDDTFGRRTLAAVRRWQEDRSRTVTGTLTADDIAFVDGEVRVASVVGQLGQPAGGDVLQVTQTDRVVTVVVPQRDADRLTVGTAVRVTVNGRGEPVGGEVVDTETADSDSGKTVEATITLERDDPSAPDAASAQVVVAGRTEEDVLSVPVAALEAAGESGRYVVAVLRRDGTTKRVPVEAGFVADGRVAVTGDLHEGDRVVVPS